MTVERALRGIAGAFVLATALLAQYHSRYWLFLIAFIGLNLLQSAFTDWCPMMASLQKLGVRGACRCPVRPPMAGEQPPPADPAP